MNNLGFDTPTLATSREIGALEMDWNSGKSGIEKYNDSIFNLQYNPDIGEYTVTRLRDKNFTEEKEQSIRDKINNIRLANLHFNERTINQIGTRVLALGNPSTRSPKNNVNLSFSKKESLGLGGAEGIYTNFITDLESATETKKEELLTNYEQGIISFIQTSINEAKPVVVGSRLGAWLDKINSIQLAVFEYPGHSLHTDPDKFNGHGYITHPSQNTVDIPNLDFSLADFSEGEMNASITLDTISKIKHLFITHIMNKIIQYIDQDNFGSISKVKGVENKFFSSLKN